MVCFQELTNKVAQAAVAASSSQAASQAVFANKVSLTSFFQSFKLEQTMVLNSSEFIFISRP